MSIPTMSNISVTSAHESHASDTTSLASSLTVHPDHASNADPLPSPTTSFSSISAPSTVYPPPPNPSSITYASGREMTCVGFNLEFAGRAYKLFDLSGSPVTIGSHIYFTVEEEGELRQGRAILIREHHLRRRHHIVYVAQLENGRRPILLLIPMERETVEAEQECAIIPLLLHLLCR
jgi:hypothetical protein